MMTYVQLYEFMYYMYIMDVFIGLLYNVAGIHIVMRIIVGPSHSSAHINPKINVSNSSTQLHYI